MWPLLRSFLLLPLLQCIIRFTPGEQAVLPSWGGVVPALSKKLCRRSTGDAQFAVLGDSGHRTTAPDPGTLPGRTQVMLERGLKVRELPLCPSALLGRPRAAQR